MTTPFFSAIIQSVENIGASPSGKATDSDSVITGVRIPVPQPKKNETNTVPLILFCFVLHDEEPPPAAGGKVLRHKPFDIN